MKFPDGEGKFAGGRTEFGVGGDELIVVTGGTVTEGCPKFPFLIGVNGKGAVKEGEGVFMPGGSCEGLLYTPGGSCAGCRGGKTPDGCTGAIPGGWGV